MTKSEERSLDGDIDGKQLETVEEIRNCGNDKDDVLGPGQMACKQG